MPTLYMDVQGMTCARCASTIRKTIADIDGVTEVEVSLTAGQAVIRTKTADVTSSQIEKAIENAGYTANASPPRHDSSNLQ